MGKLFLVCSTCPNPMHRLDQGKVLEFCTKKHSKRLKSIHRENYPTIEAYNFSNIRNLVTCLQHLLMSHTLSRHQGKARMGSFEIVQFKNMERKLKACPSPVVRPTQLNVDTQSYKRPKNKGNVPLHLSIHRLSQL